VGHEVEYRRQALHCKVGDVKIYVDRNAAGTKVGKAKKGRREHETDPGQSNEGN
jgi:hypothetical protein